MTRSRPTTDEVMAQHGTTYAEQAGITLRDEPAPLFQLLVLTVLSSARIGAGTAAASARELFRAGWRTPERMLGSARRQRVEALGRGGYRRYDESTADYLEQLARRVLDDFGGDLRRLRPGEDGSVRDLERALQDLPRIGPTGSRIFCREVQAVWPEVAPYFDPRALRTADELGWSTDPHDLARRVRPGDVARLSAALVRRGLET